MSGSISILGSGWLGLPLAMHLLSLGYSVKVSTRSKQKLLELEQNGLSVCLLDICDEKSIPYEFFQSDVLIVNITSKNLESYRRFIKAVETTALSRIKHVLFVSSTSVYANKNREIREDAGDETPDHPLIQIENLFKKSAVFNTTILRFGGLVGYQRHPGRFFGTTKSIADPDACVNLIHRDDCIGVMCKILERNSWGEDFNCCADSHPTKREFYTMAANQLGLSPPKFGDPGDTGFKIISNKKIKKALGYSFKYPDLMNVIF